jgi:flagellar motor switch protein FliM
MPSRPVSSEEIDALMDAVQTGPAGGAVDGSEEARVKTYDFARPDKFSKEQIRTLEMIYQNCARSLTNQVSAVLRTHVDVEATDIAEYAYLDLFTANEGPSSIALMSIDPLVGRGLLEIDSGICFALIDRMLGGPGLLSGEVRELTEIEKVLVGRVIERVSKCIADSWSTLVVLKPELEMIIGSELFSQIAVPEERMLVASFSVKFGNAVGRMRFGIPVTSLDPVLSKLNAQQWFSGGRQVQNQVYVESIKRSLDAADLAITVRLGSADITIRDLMDLRVGDLLRLDRKVGADVDVAVGGENKFKGQPGKVGRNHGVKLTHVLNGEEQ